MHCLGRMGPGLCRRFTPVLLFSGGHCGMQSNVTDYIDIEIRRTGKFEIKIGKKFPRCALAAASVLASQKILLAFLFAIDLRLLEVFKKTYHPEPACIPSCQRLGVDSRATNSTKPIKYRCNSRCCAIVPPPQQSQRCHRDQVKGTGCGKCGDIPQGGTGIALAFCLLCTLATSLKGAQGLVWRVIMSRPARCAFFHTHGSQDRLHTNRDGSLEHDSH